MLVEKCEDKRCMLQVSCSCGMLARKPANKTVTNKVSVLFVY